MSINLVTVCGHNTTMLRHMLNHYKDMVDEIFVVVYLSSDKDKVLSEVTEITKDLNIDITYFYSSYQKRALNTLKLILNTYLFLHSSYLQNPSLHLHTQ